jgi:hypothetical protein
LSSEKGAARVYALALLPAFCYEENLCKERQLS